MTSAIKVLLVDDHAIVRAGFRLLLSTVDGIHVVAEAARGEEVCQLFLDTQPDVTVLDLSMPGIGGLATLHRLLLRNASAKVLVFSVHDESVYVQRALAAGARGYISKSSAPDLLVEAIQRVAAGEIYVEPGLLGVARVPTWGTDGYRVAVDNLSPREFEVFLLLAKGLNAHKIAAELCLGYKTVANYGTQIKAKLNVSTTAELAHIALVLGLLEQSSP